VVVCALLMLPLGSAAAEAGLQWRTPQDLAAPGYTPEIAVSPQGTAVAVWVGWDGSHSRIQAAARPRGGSFGPPQFIGPENQDTDSPHVAMDAQGNAVAVWSINLSYNRIQAAFRPAGDNTSFNPHQTLSAGGVFAFDPAVSMDDQGNAHAIWARGVLIETSTRPAGLSSSFGPVSTVSAGGSGAYAYEPAIAAEPNGDAVALWTRFDGTALFVQAAERRPPRYEEPQSASSLRVALVPVFKQCGTPSSPPTGSHAAPLSVGSCAPATTPGAVAHVGSTGVGSAQLTVIPGDFSTAANEADFSIQVNATDVRSGSTAGPDYAPNVGGPDVTYNARLRVTDSNNGALSTDPGTTTEFEFPVPVNCTTTTGAEGSACAVNTTANAVSPGIVKEGKDMIVQVFRVRLNDSGANGIRGDSDDSLFEQQGFFVP
jgi:hypothetical protein